MISSTIGTIIQHFGVLQSSYIKMCQAILNYAFDLVNFLRKILTKFLWTYIIL